MSELGEADPKLWQGAEVVPDNDPSLWADATVLEAPNNSLYDQDNDRVLSVPQSLNADETKFVIQRDVDEVNEFFAMQEVGALKSFGIGAKGFFAAQPQYAGAYLKEQGELKVGEFGTMNNYSGNPFYADMFETNDALSESEQERRIRQNVGKALAEKGDAMIERNKKYMADAGYERPEQGGLSAFMYDLGQGSSSMLTSLGLTALTRSPNTAAVYFGAMQKSQVYAEAREAGATPEEARGIGNIAGVVEGSLEAIGLDRFVKAMGGNSAVKRFTQGFAIEAIQESSQTAGEEAITQGTGIRDKEFSQTVSDILYTGLIGGIIGGTSNAALGAFVKQEAVKRGIDEPTAERMATYAEENAEAAKQDIGEFIDKELAPIAADDAKAMEFMQIMKKFGNDVSVVDREQLDPDSRKVFDEYIDIFNKSFVDKTGVEAVEKTFYNQVKAAGVKEEEAASAAKLLGARADAASRALGITPQEWLESKKLSVVNRGKEAAKSDLGGRVIQNKPKAVRIKKDAALYEALDKIRSGAEVKKPKMAQSPILQFLKKRGGIKVGSTAHQTLRSMGITSKTVPGLYKKNGRIGNLDDIDVASFKSVTGDNAAIPESNFNVDEAWLYEQISNETFGEKLGEQVDEEGSALASLEAQLAALGVDVNQLTNAQIAAKIQNAEDIRATEELLDDQIMFQRERVTETESFKKWFGKSKVVDEGGEPLVVYHGTDKSFDEFSREFDKLGRGFWFGSSEVASRFGMAREAEGANVMPVYLRIEKPYIYDAKDPKRPKNLTELFEVTSPDKPNGYDGIIFTGGASKAYVAFKAEQIKSTNNGGAFNPNDSNILNQSARGSINFANNQALISLFKDANPSTLLHELGHLFLRDMESVAENTSRPMVKKDYKVVKEWLGNKGGDLTVAQEEKFARGFEAYLREGKAPKPELQSVFDRFKEWLTAIYKNVRDLNVDINDDIRRVFDRMLGGDFARTETLLQEAEARDMAADYEAVASATPERTFLKDTGAVFHSVSDISADFFVPASTRLGNIDQKLKHAVRQFTFKTGLYTHEDKVKIKPFVEKVSKTMTPEDYRRFDLALKNRDRDKVDYMLGAYKLQKEWDAVRDVLDNLYNQATDVELDIGYMEDYFPRKVRPNKVSEFMSAMRETAEWSEIEMAMSEADPDNNFTAEEQAAFVNTYLRGFTSKAINLSKPSFLKDRVIDYVTPQFNQYYQDSMLSLMEYVGAIRHGVESRKLFGKGEGGAEKSIGKYVLSLSKQGVIKHGQEKELKEILKAVVEPTGTRGAVAWAKNASYIYLMGSPISAITQIQDLAFSLHKNGYYGTAVSFAKSLTHKQILKKEDIGIDNILQEFESESRASASVRKVFRLIGLEAMDNVGKETFIDASYGRLKRLNKKNNEAFNEQLNTIFGDEAAQVKKDLDNGTMSENVKYLLFSELSDIQPISLAEMPVSYLRGGNSRVFYMLKTYTVRQVDIYRREIFSEIMSGKPERVAKGIRNLVSLATALMLMGMASDALKDLILGREIEVDDLVTDNILKTMTFTKYQIYKAKDEGVANAALRTLFMPPIAAPFDDVTRDIAKIGFGEKEAKDAEILGKIPLGGKFYYWWWGGGRTKEENKPDD